MLRITAFRHNRSWSGEDDLILRELLAERKNVIDISRLLGRTTRSIRRRVEVLRLSWKRNGVASTAHEEKKGKRLRRFRWQTQHDASLRELVVAGLNDHDIAAKIGRSIYAVRNRASRLKLPLKCCPAASITNCDCPCATLSPDRTGSLANRSV
jgi:hypothetical protein